MLDQNYQMDPEALAYNQRLETAIPVKEIGKMLGLNRKQYFQFKHAIYYTNRLFDDVADPKDSGQVFVALLRIEQEEIPNVPIMSNENREVHLQVLKDKAIFLLAKAEIKGLDESEVELLKRILRILLSKEDYPKAVVLVDKIRNADPKDVWTPIESNTLQNYLRMNQRKLEQ